MKNILRAILILSLLPFGCMTATQLAAQNGTIAVDEGVGSLDVIHLTLDGAAAEVSSDVKVYHVTLDGVEVDISQHAFDRHGETVVSTCLSAVSNCGEPCRYQCEDGRVRYVARTTYEGKEAWAMVVRAGMRGKVITAFICESAEHVITSLLRAECSNAYGDKHPWAKN